MVLIFKSNSIKNLIFGFCRTGGRNNFGRITSYHRGGGVKRKKRILDYNKYIWNLFGLILRVEYDPTRSSLISLVVYPNGVIFYSLNCGGCSVGDLLYSSNFYVFKPGFSTYLLNINVGVKINSIQSNFLEGSKFIRSAGAFATIISKLNNFVLIRLKSGKVRKFYSGNIATIGVVSNFGHVHKNFRKAGYFRLMGWRPVVRGVAMNPIDHPHGGGQGKTSGGRPSVNRYGFITKGKPTSRKFKPFVYNLHTRN